MLLAGCAETSETASSPPAPAVPLSICMPWSERTQQDLKVAVSVKDPSGAPVGGLRQSDFAVSSSREQFKIKHFLDSSAMHKSIVIAIDSSGSMRTKLADIDKTLSEFMSGLNSCDEVALVAFGAKGGFETGKLIYTLQPFTTDHALASRRIMELQPFGETPLYDGIAHGLNVLSSAHYPNRLLIVITDGIDNNSSVSKQQVEARARAVGHPVYLIGIADLDSGKAPLQVGPFTLGTGTAHIDVDALRDIANATGGKSFIIPEMDQDKGRGFEEGDADDHRSVGRQLHRLCEHPPEQWMGHESGATVSVPSRPNVVVDTRVMLPTPVPAS